MAPNTARLIASAATGPKRATSEIGGRVGSAHQNGACAVPRTDPAMKKSSVIDHARAAAAHAEERARRAAAAELHADAEDERAGQHRHARPAAPAR